MNKLLAGLIMLFSTAIFADNATPKTDMDKGWTCTTNASSADTDTQKAKDDKMEEANTSVSKAFKMAEKNCRDCTEITCKKND